MLRARRAQRLHDRRLGWDAVTAPIPVILNTGAGTAESADREALRTAFARRNLVAEVHALAPGQDLDAVLDAAFAGHPCCVVAAGGDGTVNAVAARLLDHPHACLGVLPLGTLNHFARDLGIPLDLDAAVRVIADDHAVAVDVGEVNDRVFLNNASIGLYADIVVQRERTRRLLGLGKWPALARATWAALRDPASFDVAVSADGNAQHRRTPFLFVGNNDYTLSGPALGQRERLDEGALSVYVLRPKNRWGLLWLGLRALVGAVSGERDLTAQRANELIVAAAPGRVPVARDGEVADFATPLRFRVRPRALRVRVPRGEPKAERG
jgi:YegS/Rv2252/BmrU family lipid kinase